MSLRASSTAPLLMVEWNLKSSLMLAIASAKKAMANGSMGNVLRSSLSCSGSGVTLGKNTACTRRSVLMHVTRRSRDACVTMSWPSSENGDSDWRISSVRLSFIGHLVLLNFFSFFFLSLFFFLFFFFSPSFYFFRDGGWSGRGASVYHFTCLGFPLPEMNTEYRIFIVYE